MVFYIGIFFCKSGFFKKSQHFLEGFELDKTHEIFIFQKFSGYDQFRA